MLGGDIGYANGYGKTKELPFFENFYGGGLGSVRGYENGTLGPKVYDDDGDKISYGGNKMLSGTAELLFPFPGVKDSRTVRMSLFADGGIMSTKPYISGSNYLKKMSDYSTENWGEIWDSLFWNFIAKNQEFFRKNPRLSMMLITWNKMTEQQKELHLVRAQNFLEKLDQ